MKHLTQGNSMYFLIMSTICMAIVSVIVGTEEFLKDRKRTSNCEDVILVSIIMASLLNIVICIALSNSNIIPDKLLCYLAFGSMSHQSILSLFTIHYIKNNAKE